MSATEEPSEELRAIVEQTAQTAKSRMTLAMLGALACHDEISRVQQRLQQSRDDEVEAQGAITALRQKMGDWIEESNQEAHIVGLCYDYTFKQIDHWRALPSEKKWSEPTVMALLARYGCTQHEKICYDLLEATWNVEAPEYIQNNQDFALRRLQFTEVPETFPSFSNDGLFPIHFPEQFWEEKQFVLVAVQRFPEALLLNLVPDHFLSHEDVFQAFVEVEPRGILEASKLWKNALFRALVPSFPNTIRSDFTLMLTLVEKCGLCLEYVDESLKGNVEIVLAACGEKADALNYCDPELLGDLDFMRKACAKKAAAWTHGTPQLKENYEFMRLVCQENPQVLEYCGPKVTLNHWVMLCACRQNSSTLTLCALALEGMEDFWGAHGAQERADCLLDVKESMEFVTFNREQLALADSDSGPAEDALIDDLSCIRSTLEQLNLLPVVRFFYRALPRTLQRDRGILDLLLKRECLTPDFTACFFTPDLMPPELTDDRGFWLGVCKNLDLDRWELLPAQFKDDPEFMASFRFVDRETVRKVLLDFPRLIWRRTFWVTVFESPRINGDDVLSLTSDAATMGFRHDRELMLLACKKDPHIYEILNANLQGDREILSAAIEHEESDGSFILSIPKRVQSMYPDLTAEVLSYPGFFGGNVQFHDIADDLRENVEVMKEFARRVLAKSSPFPPVLAGLSNTLKESEEFIFFVAKYCGTVAELEQITSAEMRDSKEFLKRAITKDKRFYCVGISKHRRDYNLCVTTLCDSLHGLPEEIVPADREFLRSVAAKAREQCVTFAGFSRGFVYGLIDNAGPDCFLPMLIQDEATTTERNKLFAEFAGVPKWVELNSMITASLHLLSTFMPDDSPRLSPYTLAALSGNFTGPS